MIETNKEIEPQMDVVRQALLEELEKQKKLDEVENLKNSSEALGIPDSSYQYQRILQGQERWEELEITTKFLQDTFDTNCKEPELQNKNKKLQFINYGDTELVFVLTVGDNRNYAVLVGQPANSFGIVKQEFANLQSLARQNPKDIVKPMYYFSDPKIQRELYIAPYLMQARCIASQPQGWGMYIPEPFYRFETFSQKESSIVNSSMVAKLVQLFDEKRQLGIGACKIGGGDFVLEKEWSEGEVTYENTLEKMKLIAARERLPMSLKEYIKHIRSEFSRSTYYTNEEERDSSILINWKSRVPMSEEEIENGIALGIQLREKAKEEQEKTNSR